MAMSPAQVKRQDNRDRIGRYTHTEPTSGLAERSSFPDPHQPHQDPPLIDLPLDHHAYTLPEDAEAWDNIPEYQLATEENTYDVLELHGAEKAREYLRELWRTEHRRFTDARSNGDILNAAYYAENLKHMENLATKLPPHQA